MLHLLIESLFYQIHNIAHGRRFIKRLVLTNLLLFYLKYKHKGYDLSLSHALN